MSLSQSKWATPAAPAPAPPQEIPKEFVNEEKTHSHLKEPVLYVSGIASVPVKIVVESLSECLRCRPVIDELTGEGSISFESLDKAEKAYAIASGTSFPSYNATLNLSISQNTPDFVPNTTPLIIRNLTAQTTPGQLYTLFRPHGPLYRVGIQHTRGFVVFYSESDVQAALLDLHLTEFNGNTITLQCSDGKHGVAGSKWASSPSTPSTPLTQSVTSYSNVIDPRNLFVKSLPSSITTTQDLSMHFSRFGPISSSKLVIDATTGKSKEHGFISFQSLADAEAAIKEMDGSILEGRKIKVSVFVPRGVREGGILNSSLKKSIGATSPPLPSDEPIEDSPLSERDRLKLAIAKISPVPEKSSAILELIEQLPKKERALCLFHSGHLRQKVQDALIVLSAQEEEPEEEPLIVPAPKKPATPPLATNTLSTPSVPAYTPPPVIVPVTLDGIGPLSCIDAYTLLANGSLSRFGQGFIQTPESISSEEKIAELLDKVKGYPVDIQKQKVGEIVFKIIKGIPGLKGRAALTNTLLDKEDLGALVRLTEYPAVLEQKVFWLVAHAGKK